MSNSTVLHFFVALSVALASTIDIKDPMKPVVVKNGAFECANCTISCNSTNVCANRRIICTTGECIVNCTDSCDSLELTTLVDTIAELNCISSDSSSCQNIKIDSYGLTYFDCSLNQRCYKSEISVYPNGEIKLTGPDKDWYTDSDITLHKNSFSNLAANPTLKVTYLSNTVERYQRGDSRNLLVTRWTCNGCTHYCNDYEECEDHIFVCYTGTCSLYCTGYYACDSLEAHVYENAYLIVYCSTIFDNYYPCRRMKFYVSGTLSQTCDSSSMCLYNNYYSYSTGNVIVRFSSFCCYTYSKVYKYEGGSYSITTDNSISYTHYTTIKNPYRPTNEPTTTPQPVSSNQGSSTSTNYGSSKSNNNNNELPPGATAGITLAIIILIVIVVLIVVCKCTKCTCEACKQCCKNLVEDPKKPKKSQNNSKNDHVVSSNDQETQRLTTYADVQMTQQQNILPIMDVEGTTNAPPPVYSVHTQQNTAPVSHLLAPQQPSAPMMQIPRPNYQQTPIYAPQYKEPTDPVILHGQRANEALASSVDVLNEV